MSQSPSLLLTLIAFVLVLGPLVLVHELGHYLVGRFFGVKANAFSIGFGKEIAGWTDRRGTRWKLSVLPLGGYVQFAGDMNATSAPDPHAEDGLSPAQRAELFHSKPLWQRALIVAAGPVTNLVVAVAIFAAFNMAYGKPVTEARVAGFAEASDARAAGLKIGDLIVAIDGNRIESFADVSQNVAYFPGRTITVSVDRGGRSTAVPIKLSEQTFSDRFGNKAKVADLGIDFAAPVIAEMASGSAAKIAGLRKGDRITAINGQAISSFDEVRRIVQPQPGKVVAIRFVRDGAAGEVPVRLGSATGTDAAGKQVTIGMLGIQGGRIDPVGPVEAVAIAWKQTTDVVRMTVVGIGQMFTGERSVKELGGPIKIAKFSGEALSLGWQSYVTFVALISINLAFINLLPIPALDGGHLAFYAAEAVRRKPLGIRSQEWAFRTGLALVLALMLFVTINDLVTLPVFGG